jgi:hypothetical protein
LHGYHPKKNYGIILPQQPPQKTSLKQMTAGNQPHSQTFLPHGHDPQQIARKFH